MAGRDNHHDIIRQGFRDGIPIGLGYLAVSFTLGITARNAGLNWFQGFITSALINASAGEYAGFTAIRDGAGILSLILVTIVANARYFLMACALSQRLDPKMRLGHRMGMGFYLTDEIFGITIARKGYADPFYTYGAAMIASPCWALGTALGIIVGNILPANFVSALSVALYGMFIAVITPAAKKDKVVAVLIVISFALSFTCSKLPFIGDMPEGTRVIILTVVIAALAAVIRPVKEEEDNA